MGIVREKLLAIDEMATPAEARERFYFFIFFWGGRSLIPSLIDSVIFVTFRFVHSLIRCSMGCGLRTDTECPGDVEGLGNSKKIK